MPDRAKPKRVALTKLATLLDLPDGVTVASVGNDGTTATVYLLGADSRRVPLSELAELLGMSTIDSIGTGPAGDDVVIEGRPAPAKPPAKPDTTTKKAGS